MKNYAALGETPAVPGARRRRLASCQPLDGLKARDHRRKIATEARKAGK